MGDLEESGMAARLHLCSQLGQMSISRISVLDPKAGYYQTRAGRAQKRLSSSFFEDTRRCSRSAPSMRLA